MKVTLIDYTGAGRGIITRGKTFDPTQADDDHTWWAAYLLIYTKSTRLQMSPSLLNEIRAWPISKVLEELRYMANTIPSSWEFVDYTFQIEGVTRAFTHQFVRSRNVSFAQQTMRVLDVSEGPGWDYLTGPTVNYPEGTPASASEHDKYLAANVYQSCMERIASDYKTLIDLGAKIEDARGILPTNILTNITAKMNLRTFVDLVHKRESSRTQGEYRDVLAAMKAEVLRAHCWVDIFLEQSASKAVNDLERMIVDEMPYIPGAHKTHMVKLLDQIRRAL
jgi:flavin-dependent thymidylate synthase